MATEDSLPYHHSRPLESVVHDTIKANPKHADQDYCHAYEWLQAQIGFYPLFLAVGETEDDLRMTGYQNQWRVKIASWYENGKAQSEYARKAEFPNEVLFSFEEVDGVFMDYDYWGIALGTRIDDDIVTETEKKRMFKKSWTKTKWLNKVKREPHSVQLVTPRLHLPNAKRVWVRNKKTKTYLESMGFSNVKTRRLTLED